MRWCFWYTAIPSLCYLRVGEIPLRIRNRTNNNKEVKSMKRTDKLGITININFLSRNRIICDSRMMMITICVLIISIPIALTVSSGKFDMLADIVRSIISMAYDF